MIFYEQKTQDFTAFYTDCMLFPSHLHKQIEIWVCLEGTMVVTCDFKRYSLEKNNWLIILPEREHSYVSSDRAAGVMLIFKPRLVSNLSAYLNKELYTPVIENPDPFLLDCATRLPGLQMGGLKTSVIKGCLYMILGALFEQCNFSESNRKPDGNLIWSILNYISDNYTSDLSLTSVARHFGISHYYLSHLFNEKIGCSFCNYLHEMRIDYAKYLLRNSDFPIVEICFACGFSTQRTFNRVFAQFTGTTPQKYQNSDIV